MRTLLPIALLCALALSGCSKPEEATADAGAPATTSGASAAPVAAKPGAAAPGAETGVQLTDAGASSQAGTKAGGG